jgi:hypothetical protein
VGRGPNGGFQVKRGYLDAFTEAEGGTTNGVENGFGESEIKITQALVTFSDQDGLRRPSIIE